VAPSVAGVADNPYVSAVTGALTADGQRPETQTRTARVKAAAGAVATVAATAVGGPAATAATGAVTAAATRPRPETRS
jgi:hypothetical protein